MVYAEKPESEDKIWDGVNAEFTPYSDDLPWCMIPEKKITVEDVKYVIVLPLSGNLL